MNCWLKNKTLVRCVADRNFPISDHFLSLKETFLQVHLLPMQYFSYFHTILQFWHLQSETYPIKSVKSIGPKLPPKTITLSPKEMDDAWTRPTTVLQVSSDCHSFVSKLYNSTEHSFDKKYFLLLLLVLKLHLTFLVKFMFGIAPAKCKDLIIVGWQNSSPVDKPGILDRAKNEIFWNEILKTKILEAKFFESDSVYKKFQDSLVQKLFY